MQNSASTGGYLVYGGSGWIGGQIIQLLRAAHETVHVGTARLEYREAIERDLDKFQPVHVINAAGVTGRPNVDWCEDHKQETIRANVIGTLNLTDVCALRNIHVTLYATGCIFEYDAQHPIGAKGFTEEDAPNFAASFYSKTKGMVETLLRSYSNILVLRVRMPISDDLHPRSFVTKITKYAKVVNVPNSMTVLHDLLPISIDLTRRGRTGVYNFTNPGAISHNEVLALYKKYIDPDFTWVNFSLDEQARILTAGRSNNELDASKLKAEYPQLPEVHVSMEQVFQRMKANMDAARKVA